MFALLALFGLTFVISGVSCLASTFMSTKALGITCAISFTVTVILVLIEVLSESKYEHDNSSEV